MTIDKIRAKIPNANTSNLIRINLPRGIGVHLEVLLRRTLPSVRRFFIRMQKKRAKTSRAALVFSHTRQRDFMRLYVVQRLTYKGWYTTNYYEDQGRAIHMAEYANSKDGCFYRVIEYQWRGVVITIKKGAKINV